MSFFITVFPEVSASFRSETSLSYIFKEPFEGFGNSSVLPSSVYSDLTLKEENVSLSFRTTQSPALLLHISSSHGKHLALLINKHGEGNSGRCPDSSLNFHTTSSIIQLSPHSLSPNSYHLLLISVHMAQFLQGITIKYFSMWYYLEHKCIFNHFSLWGLILSEKPDEKLCWNFICLLKYVQYVCWLI